MKSRSTLSRGLFATVLLPMIAQPQPLLAQPAFAAGRFL